MLRQDESPSAWRDAGVFIGSYVLLAEVERVKQGREHHYAESTRRHHGTH
jgi:hypothetical protein